MMKKYWNLNVVLLLGLCVLASENVRIVLGQQADDILQRFGQNVTQIILDKGAVQISAEDSHIKLTGKSDRITIVTSVGNIVLTNFSSLLFTVFGFNQSKPLNETGTVDAHNGAEEDSPEPEPPTDFEARQDELLLANSTRFKNWLNSTNLFHGTIITLFNITNYAAVLNGSIPVLKEEEFRFEQKRTIQVAGWEADERFVKVKQTKHYYHVSLRDLEQEITTINYPLVTLYNVLEVLNSKSNVPIPIRFVLKKYKKELDKLPLYVNVSVGDLLFRGYKDQTTKFIQRFKLILRQIGIRQKLPKSIDNKDGHFSLLDSKNGSDFGFWSVNTGKFNLESVGQIAKLNGSDKNPAWSGKCSRIEGTDGLIHSRLAGDSVSIFVPEMDRPVELDEVPANRTGDGGAKVRKFVWSNNTFASPRTWTPNQCYFPDNPRSIDGVMKKSNRTSDGEPIVFSNPHFLAGDKLLASYFGLKPNSTKHESFVVFKKDTGELVNEVRNLQINLETTALNHRINGFVWPFYWVSDVSFNSNRGHKGF